MTNSSDNAPVKKQKKKGPIRFEAIVPFAIVVVLIGAYFKFFFDANLRSGLEWVGTQLNGAEVNVASVRTSFLNASFKVGKIQVTDAALPTHNRIEIGTVHARFLWDALLRAKFVTQEFGIESIGINTKREKPGRVLPPSESELVKDVKKDILAAYREGLKTSNIAQLADFVKNINPADKVKNITGNLKSLAKIEELEKQLDDNVKQWNASIKNVQKMADISDVKKQLGAINVKSRNPVEIKNKISKIGGIKKVAEKKINSVAAEGKKVTTNVNRFQTNLGTIDDTIAQDRKNIQAQLKIPSLNAKNLTDEIFGQLITQRLEQLQVYTAMAEKYMPPKKVEKEEGSDQIKPKPRATGRNYHFGKPNSYPMFWIKEGTVSSRAEDRENFGDLNGKIFNITNDQDAIDQPSVMTVKGDFPKLGVKRVNLKLEVDARKGNLSNRVQIEADGFKIKDRVLAQNPDITMGLKSAKGRTRLDAMVAGDKINILSQNTFYKPDYDVQAKSDYLQGLLSDITSRLKTLTLNAEITGTWKSPKIGMSSNLGAAIQDAFKSQLSGRLKEVQARIDKMINEKVGAKKKALENRFNSEKKKVTSQVNKYKKQAEGAKKLADNHIAKVKKGLSGQAKKRIQGVGKQLKKKLPF